MAYGAAITCGVNLDLIASGHLNRPQGSIDVMVSIC